VAGELVELEEDSGRIVSFIARSGHGHYPRGPRTVYRHFGVGNDHLRREKRWMPRRIVWIGGDEIVAVDSRGDNDELEGGRKIWVDIKDGCLPSIEVNNRHDYITHRRIRRFGEALNVARQSWFSNAEPTCSRRWFHRFFTFMHWL
jgi:hypothetical protein